MVQATLERQAPAVLRPYQVEAFRNLIDYRMAGKRRALITLATGLGKTTIFSQLAAAQKRVLVLAHREELLDQAAQRISTDLPGTVIGIEQADRRAGDAKVIVGSVQTFAMSPDRLRRLDPAEFSVIVVDEAHHCLARTYLDVFAHFGLVPDVSDLKDADLTKKQVSETVQRRFRGFEVPQWAPYLVGCTATPNRTDGKGLEWVFDDVVFSMDIKQGIADGWLAPIKGVRVRTGQSIADVQVRGGDFAEKQLSSAVNNPERNALLVHAYEDHAFTGISDTDKRPAKQALVFCVDREHAEAVRETFERRGHAVGMVLGNTPTKERERTVNAYRRGELRVLVGVMVFTEGFDAPGTEIVIMARPTKSSLIYTQALGRCTRLAPGKEFGLVIDLEDTFRTGVQNLQTMFGLPPKLDIGKEDVLSVAKRVEEYDGQVSQERLMDAESLADIERMAEEFDPIAVAGLPSYVAGATSMAWVKTPSGYALSVLGKGDLGVIGPDLVGHATVRFRPSDGPAIDLGEYEGELDALRAAEAFLRNEHGDVAGFMDRNARWRREETPVTQKQLAYLRKLGRRDLPSNLTKGGASVLIDSLQNRKKARR